MLRQLPCFIFFQLFFKACEIKKYTWRKLTEIPCIRSADCVRRECVLCIKSADVDGAFQQKTEARWAFVIRHDKCWEASCNYACRTPCKRGNTTTRVNSASVYVFWSDLYLRVWGIATFRPRVFRVFVTAAKGPFFCRQREGIANASFCLFAIARIYMYKYCEIFNNHFFTSTCASKKKKKRGLLVTEPVWYLFVAYFVL